MYNSRKKEQPSSAASVPSFSDLSPVGSITMEPATSVTGSCTVVVDADGASSAEYNTSSHAPNGCNGFDDPAFSDIAQKLKAYNGVLGLCQHLGIQHTATLPELVLVGDQSSGKSSLMSALGRLDLPRSSGICTRCPFHIRMMSSNQPFWTCTVSLQQDFDYCPPSGRQVRQSDVTKKNPFGPWAPRTTRDIKAFKTITAEDSIQLEELLRWAQIATLNPGKGHEQYIPEEGALATETNLEEAIQHTEAKFSPNLVALEMKGPDFPDLSFYDLPGIIANAEIRGEDYLVDVVINLTKSYVTRQGALIMLALPMDHDIENSKTLRAVRDAGAEDRTIGVITKADKPDLRAPETMNFPSLKGQVESQLGEVEGQLKVLPELPRNVEHTVRMGLKEFYILVKEAVSASTFEKRRRVLNNQFEDCISKLKPKCVVGTPQAKIMPSAIEISDDEVPVTTPTSKGQKRDQAFATPTPVRRRLDVNTPIKREMGEDEETSDGNPFVDCLTRCPRMTLEAIRDEIRSKVRAVAFQEIVPIEAYESLSLRAIRNWEEPLEIYLKNAVAVLSDTLNQALVGSLGELRSRLIFKQSQKYLQHFLGVQEGIQRARLFELFAIETYSMDTMNKQSVKHNKKEEFEESQRHWTFARCRAANLIDGKMSLSPLEAISAESKAKEKKSLSDMLAKLPSEPFESEIEVAAVVRAYYLTAAARFVDGVVLDVNGRMFRQIRDGILDNYLHTELGLDSEKHSPEAYNRLMEEDQATADKRNGLKKLIHQLIRAREAIGSLDDSAVNEASGRVSSHAGLHGDTNLDAGMKLEDV
ncbi:hypothetical protein F5Y15DRAFT_411407 [Xylariaceae sp. FL0016]|nr:hypothetical protein F5Y15DRAFT_411407 [Xylariaceae sp. FL0016]